MESLTRVQVIHQPLHHFIHTQWAQATGIEESKLLHKVKWDLDKADRDVWKHGYLFYGEMTCSLTNRYVEILR